MSLVNLTIKINLCSSYIYFSEDLRATAVKLTIYIGSVPTEELEGFNEKFRMSLRRIVKEGIDMQRMAIVINRDERQVSGHDFNRIWALMTPLYSCGAS